MVITYSRIMIDHFDYGTPNEAKWIEKCARFTPSPTQPISVAPSRFCNGCLLVVMMWNFEQESVESSLESCCHFSLISHVPNEPYLIWISSGWACSNRYIMGILYECMILYTIKRFCLFKQNYRWPEHWSLPANEIHRHCLVTDSN
jgi:hypothetical protein